MPEPLYNPRVVGQGLARLTSAFVDQPNIRAQLAIYLQPFQDLEDAAFNVLVARRLATATVLTLPETNFVFDAIGALLGQERLGLDDADFKTVLYLKAAVNRATGRITDWSRFAQILVGGLQGGAVGLILGGVAAFFFCISDLPVDPNVVGSVLSLAVPNGVRGIFAYTTWADGQDLALGSVYDSTAGEQGFGSVYDYTAGGNVAAAIDLSVVS